MNITTRFNDPIADKKLIDAYFRWTLMSVADVVGDRGLDLVLHSVGLDKYRSVYAADKLEVINDLKLSDSANVNMGIINLVGEKDQNQVLHAGKNYARHAIRKNGQMFHFPTPNLLSLPPNERISVCLQTIIEGFQRVDHENGLEFVARLEEKEDFFLYSLETCPVCAGKSANTPICIFHTGFLYESLRWHTGLSLSVEEIYCRAMGDPACVWQIDKV